VYESVGLIQALHKDKLKKDKKYFFLGLNSKDWCNPKGFKDFKNHF
jgi:hypothetical protein